MRFAEVKEEAEGRGTRSKVHCPADSSNTTVYESAQHILHTGLNRNYPLGGAAHLFERWRPLCGHFVRLFGVHSRAMNASQPPKLPRKPAAIISNPKPDEPEPNKNTMLFLA